MYYFIVNPASRSGKGLKIWKKYVEPTLRNEEIPYTVYFSQKSGDVAILANEISSNIEEEKRYLIVLGGDGTVNEALQGIVYSKNLILGYIPTGSSNDLARDLKIPKNPIDALHKILVHGEALPMDIGIVTYPHGKRYFAVSCGVGFDAAVCEEVMHSKMKNFLNKIGLGKLTYLGIALKLILGAQFDACKLRLHDTETIHLPGILFSASMIHRYEGGGFMFCPQADDQDGLLDVCTVGKLSKALILFALPTAFWGKHYFFKGIYHYRTPKIEIKTKSPLYLHTDGEVISFGKEFCIECNKEQILFIR